MNNIYKKVASDLGIPLEVVKSAYQAFWGCVKTKIQELPLKEDLTEEEFNKLSTNFNIPSLGKLYCNYDRYKNVKKRFEYIKKLRNDNNNKES